MTKTLLYDDKNETEPVWLSPIFAIFQAPPMQGYTRKTCIQPYTSKARL